MKPDELQKLLQGLAKSLYQQDITPTVSLAESEHGDYSSNLAFELARSQKKPPIEIAGEIAGNLKHPAIVGVAAAGAGYLNFTFDQAHWLGQLSAIKPGYGRSKLGQGQKVQVEFISANPTGPLTLGNGRGGFSGDVLANVLAWTGHEVSREYYINDAGNQIEALKNSIYFQVATKLGFETDPALDLYKGEYIEELARPIIAEIKREHPNLKQKLSSKQIKELSDQKFSEHQILNQLIEKIKASVKQMGIEFDVWFSEQTELHDKELVEQIASKLVKSGQTIEKDASLWLKVGDESDRVIRKSDGSYTYLAGDLAYHYNKFVERGFTKVINFWGADHAGQVEALATGLEKLGVKGELEIVLFQLVRLIKDGKEYKVSKRAGNFISIDELLKEIPADVARFFFIQRAYNTHMDFDLDLAREQSNKNPFFYIMYAYVRASSIMRKAKQQGVSATRVRELVGVEKSLVKQMTQFPGLLEQISADLAVHRLSYYGHDLAKLFHEFYETVPILAAKTNQGQRLALVQHFIWMMESYFDVLGIKPRAKM
ncbi:MAG TPA: arginine--tRNA ligase [Candidatus Saccharimonadales bacterium]|nr:arginine--tRNA ligase [Candidatus Saccharimonadales bacterium]